MTNCKDCAHWMEHQPFDEAARERFVEDYSFYAQRDPEYYAKALAEREEKGHWGTCAMMSGPMWEDRREGTLAVAVDGSGYIAQVWTRENFACPMFAPTSE